VLLALAFAASLAAAAPHSVHHLGQELERQPVVCPAALAWASAGGADCPVTAALLTFPVETDHVSPDFPALPCSPPAAPYRGRAPPARLMPKPLGA